MGIGIFIKKMWFMEIEKARQILGKSFENRTDNDIQAMIDRLMPIVRLAVQEAEKEFKTVLRDPLEEMSKNMRQLDISI